MPPWAAYIGVCVGVLLVGLAAGLIIGDYRKSASDPLVDGAALRLHIYADDRTPQRLSYSNVWRWYYLKTLLIALNRETDQQQQRNVTATLFVIFDTPVKIGTLEISSPDIRLPLHEVKEFNNRYAIIVFGDARQKGHWMYPFTNKLAPLVRCSENVRAHPVIVSELKLGAT